MDGKDAVRAGIPSPWEGGQRSGEAVKQYIGKATGLSRAQVTRLVGQYAENGTIGARQRRGRIYTARYGVTDIALLAEVDEAHETLSGPATKKLTPPGLARVCRRAVREYGGHFGVAHLQPS